MNNEIIEKECCTCHFIKPIDNFYLSVHGLKSASCKECVNKKQRIKNKQVERKCRKCDLIKPIDEFGRNANNTKRVWCHECYEKFTPIELKQRDCLTIERHKQADWDSKKRRRVKDNKHSLLQSARNRSKEKNLPFNLTKEDIIIPKFCPVFGIPIEINFGLGNKWGSPSLDKIVPELGYVRGNVMVISWEANCIKNSGNANQHKLIADYIIKYSPIQEDYCI